MAEHRENAHAQHESGNGTYHTGAHGQRDSVLDDLKDELRMLELLNMLRGTGRRRTPRVAALPNRSGSTGSSVDHVGRRGMVQPSDSTSLGSSSVLSRRRAEKKEQSVLHFGGKNASVGVEREHGGAPRKCSCSA